MKLSYLSQRRGDNSSYWSLILAAGDGGRLRSLTGDRNGNAIPKQFCSLHGGASLLRYTLDRALHISSMSRTVAIVAEQHRQHFLRDLSGLFERNIITQPLNKGTAVGILLPLLHILRADPDANVVLLPSDHYIDNEQRLAIAITTAMQNIGTGCRGDINLIGIQPEFVDPELGYIVPGPIDAQGVQSVSTFVEKPDRLRAQQLLHEGALWNSFIIVGKAIAIVDLISSRQYHLVRDLRQALIASDYGGSSDRSALLEFYQNTPSYDFSRDVVAGMEAHVSVVRAASCGWADLGTPARVAACLMRHPYAQPISLPYARASVNLSDAVRASATDKTINTEQQPLAIA